MKTLASKRNLAAVERGKLLVGYLTAGFPDRESMPEIMTGCALAGLDIFELGYPADNPALDGEVIQRAHSLVDPSVRTDIDYWQRLRAAVENPIWVMAYRNDIIPSGFYLELARRGLIDALVLPDSDFSERIALCAELAPLQVDVLGFVNPDMPDAEQQMCFESFPLVYQQLYSGPTGMTVTGGGYEKTLQLARSVGNIKVFAGFGISTPERVGQLLSGGFDGAIVGTALMKKLNESPDELYTFISELKATVQKMG